MNGQSREPPVQPPPASDAQELQARVISPPGKGEENSTRRSAVFVAHGMGQHLQFATLDSIAHSLRLTDSEERTKTGGASPEPEVIARASRDGYLHGVKLRLKGKSGEHEVHVFEGYWAPLTEGEVTLRDVMGFLVTASFNGLSKIGRRLTRFLFDQPQYFPAD